MPDAWTTRCWQEFHAGNLTRASRDTLLTLHAYRGPGGIAWPAHATIAARARCCVRTVARALQQAMKLGLLSWRERRVRTGWRSLQTSNVYRFHVPDRPVFPGMRTTRTAGQPVRGGEKSKPSSAYKAELAALLTAAAAMPDLLAMRRAVVEKMLITARAVNG